MLVLVRLCPVCAAALQQLSKENDAESVAAATGILLGRCPICREQLPQHDGQLVTELPSVLD
jgi:uncharacterized protein with PIN domain